MTGRPLRGAYGRRPIDRVRRSGVPACLLLGVLSLPGCDALEPGESDAEDVGSELILPLPDFPLQSRAIDPDRIDLELLVDDEPVSARRDGETWAASFTVPAGSPVDLSVSWFQEQLLLASLQRTLPAVTADTSVTIDSSDYVSTGAGYDEDSDGLSNLAEIDAGSDPRDPDDPSPAQCPETDVVPAPRRVEFPRIDPADAPIINGLYDEIWNSAQFSDADGERLSIDNYLIDLGKDDGRRDGDTEFEWAGMHDGTNLYLFVFGEAMATGQAIADSSVLFHDDSVEIFLDADNSGGAAYDGVDDRHIIIALLDEDGNTSGRIARGPADSVALPDGIEYFNCLCTPVYTWEISIPLASLGIPDDGTGGAEFGIEIAINDDNDGGDRDSQWGWYQTRCSGNTFTDPSIMGTGVLR